MAAILPLAALGAFGIYANRTTDPQKQPRTEDDKVAENHKALLMEYGLSASNDYAMKDRQYMAGGLITYGVGVDPSQSQLLDSPYYDVVEDLAAKSVALANFDRADTLLSARVQQSTIVPRRNNQQAIALTEEVHHPSDTGSRSTFYVNKFSPAYANPRQIAEADYRLGVTWETEAERSLRAWNGSQFFERAAGQSFRYSED